MSKIVFFWDNFGPTHMDRLEAMSSHLGQERVVGIEWTSKSATYSWQSSEGSFTRLTANERVPRGRWRRFLRLWKAVWNADASHYFFCHYERWEVFLSAVCLRLIGKRVFVMNDTKFDDKARQIFAEIGKVILYLPYNGAIVGSPRSAEYLRFLGFKKRPVELSYDSISIDRIVSQSSAVLSTPPRDFQSRGFIVVSRAVPKKNLETVIRGYALYRQRAASPESCRTLKICGDGPLIDKLKSLAMELCVSDYVSFVGFVQTQEVSRLLAESAALVLLSSEEQFGFVVVEALAMGLPVIVSLNVGSRDEFVRSGINGYLVEHDNPEGLAVALEAVSSSEANWLAMSNAARTSADKGDVKHFVEAVGRLIR